MYSTNSSFLRETLFKDKFYYFLDMIDVVKLFVLNAERFDHCSHDAFYLHNHKDEINCLTSNNQ